MIPDYAHVIIGASTWWRQVGSLGHLQDPEVAISSNFVPWVPCLLHPYRSPSEPTWKHE